MASSSRALRALAAPQLTSANLARTAGSRLLTTSSRQGIVARAGRTKLNTRTTSLTRQFRRQYADSAAPKKPKRFRFLRWTWRLTYLSVLGGIAFVGYGIYLDRHPEPQRDADPSKKTLVILGKLAHRLCDRPIEFWRLTDLLQLQELDGAPSPSSRSSTPRTTTSLSSRRATTSSSRPSSPPARPAPSSTAPSWSLYGPSYDTRRPP